MLELLRKLKLPRDPIGVALVLWRAAMIIATAVTWVFSYLAAMAARSAKCAGMDSIAGYHSGPQDFWGFPLMVLLFVLLVISLSKKARVIKELKKYEQPVSRLGPMRITFGEKVIYSKLIGFVVIFGAVAATTISRYNAIAHYCGSAMALQ